MVYAQPIIYPEEWGTQTILWFLGTNESPNLGQTARRCNNKQKENLLSQLTTE